jgi:PhzF family phenazine biosynthesis protein
VPGIPCFQVDAFADRPFAGNPAAVCLLDTAADETWMQSVANEMNLSETAFVVPQDRSFGLRWFTPAVEVDLCGHATLAAAHVLWEQRVVEPDAEIRFQTRSGELSCTRQEEIIELDFPATPAQRAELPESLLAALDVEPDWQGRSRFDALACVDSETTLRSLKPDFAALAVLPYRGIIVTSTADAQDIDFVSRFFGPAAGVDEDPVTGSAHCALAPFWSERLGKSEMTAYQASARGGAVSVRVDGDRVMLGGAAVTVFTGTLCHPPGGPE